MILLKYSVALMWFTLKCVSGQCQVHIILTYYSHVCPHTYVCGLIMEN